jgi:TetR/AcrR family transcriptional repressor of nem operon
VPTTNTYQLTPKGQATRARIVAAAARLIYEHGVKATNNEMVRRAAGVSGSQLTHYFADKEQLVHAVIDHQTDAMRGRLSAPPRKPLDSIDALQRWAQEYIDDPAVITGGCSFGSLASEVLKSEPGLHDAITRGFALWSDDFRAGLQTMRDNGTLSPNAPIDTLVHTLTAAFQGGLLLIQATGDIAQLRDALNAAIDTVRHATI